MALSTVSEFNKNCQVLDGVDSQITLTDKENVIYDADLIVKSDLLQFYSLANIVANSIDFNLLSQFKSAELALRKWLAMLPSSSVVVIDDWKMKYEELQRKIVDGKPVYKVDGTVVPSNRIASLSVVIQSVEE